MNNIPSIPQLQSDWINLHDLDRAAAIRSIHSSGISIRQIATQLHKSESSLRHLLIALDAGHQGGPRKPSRRNRRRLTGGFIAECRPHHRQRQGGRVNRNSRCTGSRMQSQGTSLRAFITANRQCLWLRKR
jgi:transposase